MVRFCWNLKQNFCICLPIIIEINIIEWRPFPPLPPQIVKFSFMLQFWWNLIQNIFTCLPILIEITIFEWGSSCPSPPPLHPSQKKYLHSSQNTTIHSKVFEFSFCIVSFFISFRCLGISAFANHFSNLTNCNVCESYLFVLIIYFHFLHDKMSYHFSFTWRA